MEINNELYSLSDSILQTSNWIWSIGSVHWGINSCYIVMIKKWTQKTCSHLHDPSLSSLLLINQLIASYLPSVLGNCRDEKRNEDRIYILCHLSLDINAVSNFFFSISYITQILNKIILLSYSFQSRSIRIGRFRLAY